MINYKYLYNPDNKHAEDSFDNKTLSYIDYENGYIIPSKSSICGGVLTKDGEYVTQSSLHTNSSFGYPVDLNNVKYVDGTVIYLGVWFDVWGHWLTDNIRRLWFLKSDYYKNTFKKCKLVFIKVLDYDISENVKQLLNLLDIDISEIEEITTITRFKHVILPDESFYTLDGSIRYYTKEYINDIDRIKNNFKIRILSTDFTCQTYDKIYFSYSKYRHTRQIGEKSLEKFFEEQGYKIIYPEQHSFYEQLYMIMNCNYLASTIGSCSHNFVFAKEGTNIILIPRANYYTGYQIAIDNLLSEKTNIYYVDSSLSIYTSQEMPWSGPFYYYVSDKLCDYFNISHREIKLKGFFIYTLLGCSRYKTNKNSKLYKYYSDIFEKFDLRYSSIKPNKLLSKAIRLFVYLFIN